MYSVSDAYKLAVADGHRKSKIRAVLSTDSAVINLDDNDILKDTVYITNQCTNGNEYEYGCVYSAECGMTIKSNADRYSLYNAKLELFWSLWTGTEWEEIPLGIFYVNEPNRINDKISIKALDGMTKLDVQIVDDTTGTLPQLAQFIAEKCNIELAQTPEELKEFTNGVVQFSVQSDKVDTYRDLLAYMCEVCACFAVMDRAGKLKFVQYATEHCVELGRRQRFGNANFSDYATKYSGVKARFIAEENYAPYEVSEDTGGIVLDFGDNPIVRGLPETKKAVLTAVYDVLKNVSYTPCEIETLGNPALDLGDYIKNNSVGKENKTYYSPITYYYWTYRGKHKLRAVGGNPKLANVKDKQSKQIGSLEGDIEAKSINVKSYINADKISFSDKEKEIASLNFATTEASSLLFLMTTRLSLSLDGLLVIKFYIDSVEDKDREFHKYLARGEHFVSINELYAVNANTRHTITVNAHMEYTESDTRKQEADIITSKNFLQAIADTGASIFDNVVVFPAYDVGVIDTRIPTASIEAGCSKAILFGQGIAGSGKWDGTINLKDEISYFLFGSSLSVDNIADNMVLKLHTPTGANIAETFGFVPFSGSIAVDGIEDAVIVGEIIKDYVFNTDKAGLYTFDEYVTTNNDMFSLKTIYRYSSVEESIDSGKMCSVALDYTGINVESVVVNNG